MRVAIRAAFALLAAIGLWGQAAHKTAPPAPAVSRDAGLAREIERIIAESPVAQSAAWGIEAIDLRTGRAIVELNANHYFVPASNTKLFSTSLALTRLGPAYTFETRVTAAAPPDADGVIAGDLTLVGGGDPNLSGRALPYKFRAADGDPLGPLADLAAQVAAAGVKRVNGDIVGDDRYYVWEPYGAGWGIDDPLYDYGAPVSALTVDDNAFRVHIRPGATAGAPALLELTPAVDYYTIDNRIRTTESGDPRIHNSRAPGSTTLELWGAIPLSSGGQNLSLSIEDPARYAAIAFRQLLLAQGITVTGNTVSRHMYPYEVADLRQGAPPPPDTSVMLAHRTSAPLLQDLQVTAKVSQNLHAELDLRAVGKARRNMGSVEAGLEELRSFVADAGVPADGYTIHDGSGLARLNLVTPRTVVQLLKHMYAGPQRDNFLSILPLSGVDGTLNSRFPNPALAGRIHAKTGSLSHVSALSGYAQRPNGNWLAFSILVNNYNGATSDIHDVMDKICELLVVR